MEENFKTPILFLIFNRPDTTQKVFNKIRLAKPKYLYVAADGPRLKNNQDIERCEQTRNIIKQIDWDCEIKTLYRKKNLGCRNAVSSTITWFFDNVEEGIILEDDVLSDSSFFFFCEEMLEKYRDDKKIFQINGTTFLTQKQTPLSKASYFYSKYPFIWDWATWKRAWNNYDIEMSDFQEIGKTNFLKKVLQTKKEQKYFYNSFKEMYYQRENTWDTQWVYAVMKNNGICITPNNNLTVNIGTNNQSTHEFLKDSLRDNRTIKHIIKPIIHLHIWEIKAKNIKRT